MAGVVTTLAGVRYTWVREVTEDQFNAAITHYTSPMARPFEEVFIYRDADGREAAISVFCLLRVAEAELYKRRKEALAFRAIKESWEKHRSISVVADLLDARFGS